MASSPAGVSTTAFTGSQAISVAAGDASGSRLANAGLTPGANGLLSDIAGSIFGNIGFKNSDGSQIKPEDDWRVRVSMAKPIASLFYNNGANKILSMLNSTTGTSGVIFPYTPTITLSHTARYQQQTLTHSNYTSYFYEGSEIGAIQINGEFTVQNIAEGQYLMAAIQFFRICTKMFFGKDQYAGSPPPLVFLDGYGDFYLPHIPCVVTQFSHTMPGDVDYVQIPMGDIGANIPPAPISSKSMVRLPTSSSITISLQPVYSRKNIADNFTLDQYSRGLLYRGGNSDRGGFI